MSLILCFKTLNMDWEFLFLNKYLGEAPFWRQDRFHKFNPFWQLQRWHCETSTNQLPTKFNNNNTNLLFSMQIKPNKCLIACYHIFHTHNAFIRLHTHIIAFMHILNVLKKSRQRNIWKGFMEILTNPEYSRTYKVSPRNTWFRFIICCLTVFLDKWILSPRNTWTFCTILCAWR